MNKLTVTIGIPAYHAEKTIQQLLRSLLKQQEITQQIVHIIVYYDVSGDNTLQQARAMNDKRIVVIDGKIRKGFAHGVKTLLQLATTDVVLLLNDDVKITDDAFLEKLIRPFLAEKNVGLVCGKIQPLPSRSFIAEAVRSGFIAYQKMGEYLRNGNNVYTCDGKSLCFSRKFVQSIQFPDDLRNMGNVDGYMYFACLKNKFTYRYARDAVLYFHCPSTVKDFTKWQIRNYTNSRYIFRQAFGELAEREYSAMPTKVFRKYKLIEFMKNPLGSMCILLLGYYCLYKTLRPVNKGETTWDTVQTTKKLL